MTARIVDSHQHVNWHQRNVDGLIRDMDAHGISYAWLLTWYTLPDDPISEGASLNPVNVRADGSQEGITLRDIVEATENYPDRFVVGYCPHPRWRNACKYLENAHRMHGARVCGEWKFRTLIDDPRSLEIFHLAGSLGMPVVLHLDVPYLAAESGGRVYFPNWYGGTVENLERALQACPDTTFIGHAPGFWREISADADAAPAAYPDTGVVMTGKLYRLFDDYPNLYADLSAGSARIALSRDPEHAVSFIERFSDRLLFGRDQYGRLLYEFLETLSLEPAVRDQICYQNAERLVKAP